MADRDICRVVARGVSTRVSLKVSYGVLVAALDRGTCVGVAGGI